MALPKCGATYKFLVPYDTGIQRVFQQALEPGPDITTCKQICATPLKIPSSFQNLTQCASCLVDQGKLQQQYGCSWCNTVLAPLQYVLNRRPSLSDVKLFLDERKEYERVINLWDQLTTCEKASAQAPICFYGTGDGLPYAESSTPETSSSPRLATVWIVLLSLLGFALFVIFLLFAYVKFKGPEEELTTKRLEELDSEDQALHYAFRFDIPWYNQIQDYFRPTDQATLEQLKQAGRESAAESGSGHFASGELPIPIDVSSTARIHAFFWGFLEAQDANKKLQAAQQKARLKHERRKKRLVS